MTFKPSDNERNKVAQMTDKALISDLTWRSLEMQRAAFPGMPHFMVPDDLPQLFRVTTRKGIDRLHVKSLGILADNEKTFREVLSMAKKRKCEIVSQDEGRTFIVNGNCEYIVKMWGESRRNGAAKIGANISADRKKVATKAAIDKIKDRWGTPSHIWPTKMLLEEAGRSLNTVKSMLGPRPVAQRNYDAKIKRKERADANRI